VGAAAREYLVGEGAVGARHHDAPATPDLVGDQVGNHSTDTAGD
jgi:hypothetical protein